MPPASRVVVVGNPRARLVKGGWQAEVERGFGRSARVDFLEAAGRAELERIASDVATAGDRLLVVAGGDGSVNWVVNALAGAPVAFGLLPLGTANDLARGLALPGTLAETIARIRSGRRRRCDLLSVNGRRFCTVGGLGVAADSALSTQALRDNGNRPLRWALERTGLHAYWLVAGAKVLQAEPANQFDIRVRPPGGASERSFSLAAHAIFVANQTTVGGRLRISPGSRNDDGVFELCILPARSRGAVLGTLGRLVLGMTVAGSALDVIPATRVRITCRRPTRFFGDGEGLGTETDSFEIEVQPGALDLVGA